MAKTTTNDVRVIEGWAQHADADHGTGYELGGGAGWCDFSECGDPAHGDKPATLVIGDKAMPMSQVVAMVRELLDKTAGISEFASAYFKPESAARTCAVMRSMDIHINNIAAKYGVKLP